MSIANRLALIRELTAFSAGMKTTECVKKIANPGCNCPFYSLLFSMLVAQIAADWMFAMDLVKERTDDAEHLRQFSF